MKFFKNPLKKDKLEELKKRLGKKNLANTATYSLAFLALLGIISGGVLYYFSTIQTKEAKASQDITIIEEKNIDLSSGVCSPETLKDIGDETTCTFKLKGGIVYSLPRLNVYALLNQNFKKEGSSLSGALGYQSYLKAYIVDSNLVFERIPLRVNTLPYSDDGKMVISDKVETLKTGKAKISIIFGQKLLTSTNEIVSLERTGSK